MCSVRTYPLVLPIYREETGKVTYNTQKAMRMLTAVCECFTSMLLGKDN